MNVPTRVVVKILSIMIGFALVLLVLYMSRRQLAWMGLAFFLAVALNPFVERLSKYLRNRALAIASVFVLALVVLTFLVVSFVPPLVMQSQQLVDNLPRYTNDLVHGHGFVSDEVRRYGIVERLQQSQSQIVAYVSTAGSQFLTLLSRLFSGFVAGITVFGLTFFMLLEGPHWLEVFWGVVPADRRKHWRQLVDAMYHAVTGYSRGILLTASISATSSAIVMTILGVPYAIPLGIFVGLLGLLPLIGATLAATVVVVVALFTSPLAALVMLIYFLIYQQVENHIIQPLVVGRSVEISPLLVLMAVLIGISVGGILGALVAIPLFASLQILARDYATRHLKSD
ncbi:MAG TPA: AI-2E family transporter [Candidatus Saccharimonas sp.]|nr:AI-2E family transporter [Candidatus Saccharimonas sp.]